MRWRQVLSLAPEVFLLLPVSSGLMNPIGRLGGSGGVMSSGVLGSSLNTVRLGRIGEISEPLSR